MHKKMTKYAILLSALLFTGCGGGSSSSSDTSAPTFTSSNSVSVNENQTSAITLVATDSSSITYSLSGTDSSFFDIDSSSSIITFKVAPDFEAKNSYSFTAIASDSSNNSSSQEVTINILDVDENGIFIDDIVSGIKYINGSITAFTDINGNFQYIAGSPISFYIGNIKIGEIEQLPSDNKVFIQDLVGVDRNNTSDEKVIKIAKLLQSIDSDETDKILITEETFKKFESISNNIENIDIDTILINNAFSPKSENSVMEHLENSLVNYGIWSTPAGSATVDYDKLEPFMKTIINIEANEIGSVSQGRELFIAQWQAAPGTRSTLDGLGPMFNADACTACHVSDGRVAPFNTNGGLDDSFLFRVGDKNGSTHPIYGGQFQTHSTVGEAEASISLTKNETTGKIEFSSIPNVKTDGFNLGPRIAPHLLGMGLLDLVPQETILEYEDENDENNDGISGRAHWVFEENETRLGRFGWKAINSTLRTQNAGAFHQDMGLTSSVNSEENCTSNQEICSSEPNGGYPEVSEDSLQAIVNFMTTVGVPQRRIENQENFDKGAILFNSIGCASCHRPTMITGESTKFKSLSNQKIYPYTDLLLHDMGENLSDGVKEKDANASEWRTPPLWGIGIVEQKEGARFLHDGRASTIQEAILEHSGEAQKIKEKFVDLDSTDKENLLTFLRGI
jgi:CxxC motif-containing protein (DUF1111 family)